MVDDVRLLLLGSPRLQRGGTDVAVDTRKATALLAHLAMTRQPQARDVLAALLWPDSESTRARAALRRTLSTLNAGLGPGRLRADRRVIALEGDTISIDVAEFRALAAGTAAHGHDPSGHCAECIAPLRAAAALYRGDFMAGFSLRDAAPFEEWQLEQADDLHRELARLLERLARALAAGQSVAEAAEVARRWLALDPLHEPAHQELIRLYAMQGQRSAALRQYRELVGILDRELGVPPLEETTALLHAVADGSFVLADPPAQPPPSDRTQPEPLELVGRAGDLATLEGAYDAVGPAGRLAVIQGEAGAGKTRLAEELVARLAARGAEVVAVRCYEGETDLAFAPVATAVRRIAERQQLPRSVRREVSRLVPELTGEPAAPFDQPGVRTRFLAAVARVLSARRPDGPPSVLVVDDLHWADDASLDVLAYLVRRLGDHPVLLVVSWPSEAGQAIDQLQRMVTEASRRSRLVVVQPKPLSEAEIATLAGEPALAQRIHTETGGLPLFVAEYLSSVQGGGAPADDRGMRDLLRTRAQSVTQAAAQLLAASAVVGRPCDADLLRHVAGRSEEEAVTGLEELVARRLVTEFPDGRYAVAHPSLRETVLGELTLARRRLLHRRTAATLSLAPPADLPVPEAVVANHLRLAGDDDAAAAAYATAAERARRLGADVDALEHLRAAVALTPRPPATLHQQLGDVLTSLGRYREALTSYETAAATADGAALADIEHRLARLHLHRGDWELADVHLQAAVSTIDPDGEPATHARLWADRGLVAHHRGEIDTARDAGAAALELATRAADEPTLAQAHNLLGLLAAETDLAGARRHFDTSLSIAEDQEDLAGQVAVLNNLALAWSRAGERDRAIRYSRAALDRATQLGDHRRQAALHGSLAEHLHAAGREDEAAAHQDQSEALVAGDVEPPSTEAEIWKLIDW